MTERCKVLDVELSRSLDDIENLQAYRRVHCLVRFYGTPIRWIDLTVRGDRISAQAIRDGLRENDWYRVAQELIQDGIRQRVLDLSEWFNLVHDVTGSEHGPGHSDRPSITVAVCTRDRANHLERCLNAIDRLDHTGLEVLVVDNAPNNDATRQLVTEHYPRFRYIREDRPGLDWARNRVIKEATGDIVAYTDDDVVVDPGWTSAIARLFRDEPDLKAMTGLVVPLELETRAQRLFELYGGFDRGFDRKWVRIDPQDRHRKRSYGTGQYGTGANMAFRRDFLVDTGGFDPALDVGTVTNGGGDLEMLYRVLRDGHLLVYEPRAIVRHRHRREYTDLYQQITNNGIGLVSYFVRSVIDRPRDRWMFTWLMWWWLLHWHIGRLLRSYIFPSRIPRELIKTEFAGYFRGIGRYHSARRQARKLADGEPITVAPTASKLRIVDRIQRDKQCMAVRLVNLADALPFMDDVAEYWCTRIEVFHGLRYLGNINVVNRYGSLGPIELGDRIVKRFWRQLCDLENKSRKEDLLYTKLDALKSRLGFEAGQDASSLGTLSEDISVSVVIATLDRPAALRDCLKSLVSQETSRVLEVIVVDNNPSSGMTAPVVSEYHGIRLLSEIRRGLSYARNCGIVAARGDIVIAVDDDVTCPNGWLEMLIAPFERDDVAVVTGNVFPRHLDSRARVLFERYGGLGRGAARLYADTKWMNTFKRDAVPTWRLGATANAAFRSDIFVHPDIGLLEEMLGVGTPTGCSEDTDLFYRVLKSGQTIVYQPDAYVWHDHRDTMAAFYNQIYSYSKGHVAYHLIVAFRYGDTRSLRHILTHLPKWHLKQIYRWLRSILRGRRPAIPMSLILVEIVGYLAGPWSLVLSMLRVRRLGRVERPTVLPS